MPEAERTMSRDLVARRVTAKRGRVFAEEWIRLSFESGGLYDAFAFAKLIEWPGADDSDERERLDRFRDLRSEIVHRMVEAMTGPISEAFVAAAREVLARERRADVASGQDV